MNSHLGSNESDIDLAQRLRDHKIELNYNHVADGQITKPLTLLRIVPEEWKFRLMSFNDINKVLTTTRSVRRRLDFSRPIAPELIEECLEIAVQAPTAKNAQEWRFIVIIDPAQRAALGAIYKSAFLEKWGDTNVRSDSPNSEQARMMASAHYLVEHIGQAPVLILFCAETALEPDSLFELSNLYGTIMPAAWSFMLAAKSRGLACCWTNAHLIRASESARLLNLPGTFTQAVLMPVAYYLGKDFKPAKRKSAKSLTFWNCWAQTVPSKR